MSELISVGFIVLLFANILINVWCIDLNTIPAEVENEYVKQKSTLSSRFTSTFRVNIICSLPINIKKNICQEIIQNTNVYPLEGQLDAQNSNFDCTKYPVHLLTGIQMKTFFCAGTSCINEEMIKCSFQDSIDQEQKQFFVAAGSNEASIFIFQPINDRKEVSVRAFGEYSLPSTD